MTAADIDTMERQIAEDVYDEHGIVLAGIGIYSTDSRDDDLKSKVYSIIRSHDGVIQIHGFFADAEQKKMSFDVILDFALKDRYAVLDEIRSSVSSSFPDWTVNITMDLDI